MNTKAPKVTKGIILAGGYGTRLSPMTQVVNKHLLPVYDKPMVYYPLSVLIASGVRDVLVISSSRDINAFKTLLGDGAWLGMHISFAVQPSPHGVPDAFIVGCDFIGKDNVVLALGDNILFGGELIGKVKAAIADVDKRGGGVIFTKGIDAAQAADYGTVEEDESGTPIKVEEKHISNAAGRLKAVAGLYCYDNKVIYAAKAVKVSARGETEIRDVNRDYVRRRALRTVEMTDVQWFDAGTPERLLAAGIAIEKAQRQTGMLIGCIEEAALDNGWIDNSDVERLAAVNYGGYGGYLERIAKGG